MPLDANKIQIVATCRNIMDPKSGKFFVTFFTRRGLTNNVQETQGLKLKGSVCCNMSQTLPQFISVCAFTLQVLRSYNTLPCAPVLLQILDVHPRLGSSKCVSKAAYVTWTNSIQYTHLYTK